MRVLVADDDVALADVLCRALCENGHSVDVVGDGRAVLVAVGTTQFDAIVLDWRMPAMDGLQTLNALRGRSNTVPVLMLTACDTLADRAAALQAGASAYLVKPFLLHDLLATLAKLEHAAARGGEGPSPAADTGESAGRRSWRASRPSRLKLPAWAAWLTRRDERARFNTTV
jgi:DNA-binding response OmpR family regulator